MPEEPESALGLVARGDNLLLWLFKKVMARDRQAKTQTTLLNFETAAFHLSYLLKASKFIQPLELGN